MNPIEFLDRGFRRNPGATCLINGDTGQTLTYAEVRDFTLRAASILRRRFSLGAKAAVLAYNDPIGFACVLALLRAGLTWVQANPRNSAAENAAVLKAFDCEMLFYSSAFSPVAAEMRRIQSAVRDFVCLDRPPDGAQFLGEWLAAGAPEEIEVPHDAERLYAIQPTGGTTGFPKGVMGPNRALENMVANLMAVAPCSAPPVFLAAAPLTHAAGVVMQYILAQGGAAVVFPKIDRQALLAAIPRYGVTHTFLPPTVIYDLLAEPNVREFDYASLRYFFYGASPIAPEKLRAALETFGPVMCQVYGQTETAMPTTCLTPADHYADGKIASDKRLSSCGRQSPFSRVEIMDEGRSILPPGRVGEIAVRGQGIMLGYYKNPELTEEVLVDGWLFTGDLGYMDEDGFFYIVDRKRDIIISGGFNVYSLEVERALLAHPAVQECAVIGVPDQRWGEAVKAIVQLKPSAACEAADLIAFCKEQIGSLKAPKSVDFVAALPRSAVGKVLKRELKKKYWEGRDKMVS